MSTEVAICSNALVLLGGKTIASLTENTPGATAAANLYPGIRNAILRSHPWNCATKRVALAPNITAPAFDWDYAFDLPGDWLRTLSVGEIGTDVPYAMEGRQIFTDDNPCYLRYLWRNTNPANWDDLLIDAVTIALAARLALPITGSAEKANAFAGQLSEVLLRARSVDGQEEPPAVIGIPILRAARR